ncbi:MAG: hypothetical protein ABJA34_14585, partial [Pseudonocardiales bacterium]
MAFLECVVMGFLFGQNGGELPGALGVADRLEGVDPGRAPVDRTRLCGEVMFDPLLGCEREGKDDGNLRLLVFPRLV